MAARLRGETETLRALGSGGSKPDLTLGDITQAGAEIDGDYDTAYPAVVVELAQEDGPEFWAGFDNFHAITRYNHSNLYAMAVYQLSEAIREQHGPAPGGDR